jgi:hypothetical protein
VSPEYKGPVNRGPGSPPPKPKHNWTNKLTRESRRRDRMLDKGKENYFKYDMEDLLKKSKVPEERRLALAATLFAKGSRGLLQDAKDFAKEKLVEGMYDEGTYKQILVLLDGYSIWR